MNEGQCLGCEFVVRGLHGMALGIESWIVSFGRFWIFVKCDDSGGQSHQLQGNHSDPCQVICVTWAGSGLGLAWTELGLLSQFLPNVLVALVVRRDNDCDTTASEKLSLWPMGHDYNTTMSTNLKQHSKHLNVGS